MKTTSCVVCIFLAGLVTRCPIALDDAGTGSNNAAYAHQRRDGLSCVKASSGARQRNLLSEALTYPDQRPCVGPARLCWLLGEVMT